MAKVKQYVLKTKDGKTYTSSTKTGLEKLVKKEDVYTDIKGLKAGDIKKGLYLDNDEVNFEYYLTVDGEIQKSGNIIKSSKYVPTNKESRDNIRENKVYKLLIKKKNDIETVEGKSFKELQAYLKKQDIEVSKKVLELNYSKNELAKHEDSLFVIDTNIGNLVIKRSIQKEREDLRGVDTKTKKYTLTYKNKEIGTYKSAKKAREDLVKIMKTYSHESLKSLAKYSKLYSLMNQVESYELDGFSINKINGVNRTDLINNPKKYDKTFNIRQVESNNYETMTNLRFKIDVRLSERNLGEFMSLITENLRKLLPNKGYDENRRFYEKYLVKISVYDSIQSKMDKSKILSTPYLSYNEALKVIKIKIEKTLNKYEEFGVLFDSVNIETRYSKEDLKKKLVFSSYNQTRFDLCRAIKEQKIDLGDYGLVDFDTRTRCFAKCVVMRVWMNDDVKTDFENKVRKLAKSKKYMKQFGELENTSTQETKYYKNILSNLLDFFSEHYNLDISVRFIHYNNNDNIDRYTNSVFLVKAPYRSKKVTKTELVIFENHCLLRIHKSEFDKIHDKYKDSIITADNLNYPSIEVGKHLIKPLRKDKKGKVIPLKENNILTYDFETYNKITGKYESRAVVYQAAYYDGSKVYQFDSRGLNTDSDEHSVLVKFLDSIDKNPKLQKGTYYMYAHNGGGFDGIILSDPIIYGETNWTIHRTLTTGRIKKATLSNGKIKLILCDSSNHLTGSLDYNCKSYKTSVKKLEGEVDHNTINQNNFFTNETYEKVKKYLENDVISLYEVLEKYRAIIFSKFKLDINDLLSSASLAKRVFSLYYANEMIESIYTLDEEWQNLHKKFFFGGRNEVFGKLQCIKGKFSYVDFTSLYPYIMWKYTFYTGKYREYVFPDKKDIQEQIEKYILSESLFGNVLVEVVNDKKSISDPNYIPLLGIKPEERLIFPKLAKPTIMLLDTKIVKYCIDNKLGYIFKYLKIQRYYNKTRFFKSLVERLYDMKKDAEREKKAASRSTAKIVINSLYGFFGQNLLNNKSYVIEKNTGTRALRLKADYIRNVGRLSKEGNLYEENPNYFIYEKMNNILNKGDQPYNLGIASSITQLSRLEIFKLIKDINDSGRKTYYCDTDSLIFEGVLDKDSELYNKYFVEDSKYYRGLGCLTNEVSGDGHITDLVLNGCKFYAYKTSSNQTVIKFKGVNTKDKYLTKMIKIKDGQEYIILKDRIGVGQVLKPDDKVYSIDYDIMKRINKGSILIVDTLQFFSGIERTIIDRKGIKVLNNFTKEIKMKYTKANVDSDNNLETIIYEGTKETKESERLELKAINVQISKTFTSLKDFQNQVLECDEYGNILKISDM